MCGLSKNAKLDWFTTHPMFFPLPKRSCGTYYVVRLEYFEKNWIVLSGTALFGLECVAIFGDCVHELLGHLPTFSKKTRIVKTGVHMCFVWAGCLVFLLRKTEYFIIREYFCYKLMCSRRPPNTGVVTTPTSEPVLTCQWNFRQLYTIVTECLGHFPVFVLCFVKFLK